MDAQPSLSQAIAGLERELGVDLFHRVGRRAILTPAGEEPVGNRIEEQPLMLIVNPRDDTFAPGATVTKEQLAGCRVVVSQSGSLMRWMVDDVLASGVDVRIVVEVAHRTSILPLVLSGVGHAVMPSSWEPLAAQVGLRTLRIEPTSTLHVAVISRTTHLTAAAASFLEVAEEYATHLRLDT